MMMAVNAKHTLEKVASEVLSEVGGELEEGRNDALQRVRTILQQTKEESAKIVEGGERQAESAKRQILGAAELETRNRILRALEEASNQVFREALDSVSKSSSQYERSLGRLIREGVAVIGKNAVVECNSKDRKAVSSIIKEINSKEGAKLTLGEDAIEAIGGITIRSKDGSMRFDNTFEARLERMRPQLRRDVVQLLSS